MTFEGKEFWNNIDKLLRDRDLTLTDMCNKTGIAYNTVNGQRVRQSLPKLDQLLSMSRFLGTSMENLIMPSHDKKSPQMQRIDNIRKACLIASEEDLKLVERILRIDSAKQASRFAFVDSHKI